MKKNKLTLNNEVFRDKVMGCWLGKNAGGTLGEPLEGKFGKEEMFDVCWYPNLPEGGIPNDDLEIQLIWLQALLQKGPGITSVDLVEYWLDCIAYNFDEYGLSKTNMKKGLLPPVCGWYNNAFRDCMGSPIRSEIWACVTPGHPEIAAKYAFNDAICDHGGGESVFGEVYNAVVQSAAFVMSDKFKLIELGLASIPEDCLTHQSIAMAVELFRAGVDWKESRNRLKERFYNPIAQYSPLNLGFQTIGWLYGEDFGDAICKAVNCGWDTDCTAATLGATLGIIMGAKKLPKKWIEPLGDKITTNMSTGGIQNLTAPTNINELTDIVCEQARRVLRYWGCEVEFTDFGQHDELAHIEPPDLSWMEHYRGDTLRWELGAVTAELSYHRHAAITGDAPSQFCVRVSNPHPVVIKLGVRIELPNGWRVLPQVETEVILAPKEMKELLFEVIADGQYINETNRGWIILNAKNRPAMPALPLVFVGGSRWLVSELFEGKTIDDYCGVQENSLFDRAPEGWSDEWRTGNDLELSGRFTKNGVIYLLHHLWSEEEKPVVVGVPNNGRMKVWMNGTLLHQTREIVPLRANQGNGGAVGDTSNYKTTVLRRGWNRFLIKLEQVNRPMQAHFVVGELHPSSVKNHGEALLGVNRSGFDWEKKV
ncbi:MAG: ADP-ribosylglycohydrolase family protein [Firmicutes bacterium]|nr:ADP-ribosylglycohydrolase family protein [Bacillota bacterium]